MDDRFNINRTSWIPMNKQNNKSAAQAQAEEICKKLNEPGTPVLVDPNSASPFWINGKLVLVSSNTTTKAEEDAVAEAEKKNSKVIVVDYDANNNRITKRDDYNSVDEMQGVAVGDEFDQLLSLLGVPDEDIEKMTAKEKLDAIEDIRKNAQANGIGAIFPKIGKVSSGKKRSQTSRPTSGVVAGGCGGGSSRSSC